MFDRILNTSKKKCVKLAGAEELNASISMAVTTKETRKNTVIFFINILSYDCLFVFLT